MLLTQRLQELGINIEELDACTLKKIALNYLRNGNGTVARSFRGNSAFVSVIIPSTEKFLNSQAADVPATDIEATALAELFGCNLTVITNTATYSLYNTGNDNAPVIHLTNLNNSHWSYKDKNSSGEGRNLCLYNSFISALKDLTKDSQDYTQQQPKETAASTNRNTLFSSNLSSNNESKIISEQQERLKIFNSFISKSDKPNEADKKAKAEEERISALSRTEQIQIEGDHAMALDMACNPSKYDNRW